MEQRIGGRLQAPLRISDVDTDDSPILIFSFFLTAAKQLFVDD